MPFVNRVMSCHLSGEERRAFGLAEIQIADVIDAARDNIGTIRPDDCSMLRVHSGWVPNRNTDRAVTASCAERMAYTREMKVWRDSRVRKESIFSLVAARSRGAAASDGVECV